MSAPADHPAPGTRPTTTTTTTTLRTVLFIVVVGGVLGTFYVLGQQGRPPFMPATEQHKLKINPKGQLVGFVGEPDVELSLASQFDQKAVEKRVNTTCQSCHGAPGDDPRVHVCGQSRCLPQNHPPKSECIKCHRMPPSPTSR